MNIIYKYNKYSKYNKYGITNIIFKKKKIAICKFI